MNRKDNLIAFFNHEDKESLLMMVSIILDHYRKSGMSSWQSMNGILLNRIKKIKFERLIKSLPRSETYHRISLCRDEEPIDIVLFVFKSPLGNGEVALIHTYDSHQPNDLIFSSDKVINPVVSNNQGILIKTPPHTHKAKCHSCVAWLNGNSLITEQFYQLKENNTLFLCENNVLSLYNCQLEDSLGKKIHSISVTFNTT